MNKTLGFTSRCSRRRFLSSLRLFSLFSDFLLKSSALRFIIEPERVALFNFLPSGFQKVTLFEVTSSALF